MTIAITIRTATAAVFVADSKLTTAVYVGRDAEDKPQFLPQTYDNAVKIIQDHSGSAIASVAGEANLGSITLMDYIRSSSIPLTPVAEEQSTAMGEFASGIAALRAAQFKNFGMPEAEWPASTVVIAVAHPRSSEPLVWQMLFKGETPEVAPIKNRLWFSGTYRYAFSVMYGYNPAIADALAQNIEIDGKPIGDGLMEKLNKLPTLRPLDMLSLDVIPIQDAVELGYFLATVEIEMERFLPGNKYCGGAIDVAVLRTAPTREILWGAGKTLRHPTAGRFAKGDA
jgi:hypothetical protein